MKYEADWFTREILSFCKKQTNGFFIEAGAADGIHSSVGLMLEREFGWSGLNVEANPFQWKKLKNKRPNSINVCVALHDKLGTATLITREGMKMAGGAMLADSPKKWNITDPLEVEVETIPLSTVLETYKIREVDLFVLDVEGSEAVILSDLARRSLVRPTVIVVEYDKTDQTKLQSAYLSMGYSHVGTIKNNLVLRREKG